jgi:hypothetical protein
VRVVDDARELSRTAHVWITCCRSPAAARVTIPPSAGARERDPVPSGAAAVERLIPRPPRRRCTEPIQMDAASRIWRSSPRSGAYLPPHPTTGGSQ